jgi:hypothetical protein
MLSVITADPGERAQLGAWRNIGAMVASLPIGIILPILLYDENDNIIGNRLFPVAIILGVLVGTIAPDVVTLAGMISDGELPGVTYGDIPSLIVNIMAEDSEYMSGVISNTLMGLLFAGLGVFALLRKAGAEVADTKFKRLG